MFELFKLGNSFWLVVILALWTLPWKGVALWKAANLNQRNWFIILLIVNTVAILEIIYIFAVARPREKKSGEMQLQQK